MIERVPTESAVPDTQPELTPLERREQIIGRLVARYSDILRDGRYDRAFNWLSPYLFDLRSVQIEIEQEREGEA